MSKSTQSEKSHSKSTYSIKAVLVKRKSDTAAKPTDLFPIKIKTIKKRKTSFETTGFFVKESQWNPATQKVVRHENAEHINMTIAARKTLWESTLLKSEVSAKNLSVFQIKREVNREKTTEIFGFIQQYINENRKINPKDEGGFAEATLKQYGKLAKNLAKFNKGKKLNFEDIDLDFLIKYEAYIVEKTSSNYACILFQVLKTMFNAAKKKGLITNYPFTQHEAKVYIRPEKDRLTEDELIKLEEYVTNTNDPRHKNVGTAFLLACYTGIRISDWQRFNKKTNIIEDKKDNHYISMIAKKNKKHISVIIPPTIMRILENVSDKFTHISSSQGNRLLKEIMKKAGIDKHVTSHTGRHTFASTICAIQQDLKAEECSLLMGINLDTCTKTYYRTDLQHVHDKMIKTNKENDRSKLKIV